MATRQLSTSRARPRHSHCAHLRSPRFSALGAACLIACGSAWAQGTAPQQITITGASATNSAGIAGFSNLPLARVPLSATALTTSQLADAGITSLGDITRLDAGLTDAYNAPGYWGQVAVRGYTLDNRFNFRRDGLPINAETALPMANKGALELLKGTSGLQAGTSAPGGLLNLVVKRPQAQALRSLSLDWTQPGTFSAEADLADRAGVDGAFGWRINAAAAHLNPMTRSSRGSSHLIAGAVEWKIGREDLLELELESNRQSQPSTPGFSLLGNQLPAPASIDPRLNLNNQAWSLPVVFEGRTGSVRYTHALDARTRVVAHLMQQSLRTDDRIAFPFGCSAADDYSRYCGDGSFDLYDFRSENERRTSQAGQLHVEGLSDLAGTRHQWRVGVLGTRFDSSFQRQAYNWVGVGRIDGSVQVGPDPTLTDENTNRREHSTEFFAQDMLTLTPALRLWAGARHTQLQRASVRTDGSRATDYPQSFSVPWAALGWQPVNAGPMAYLSWGQGAESEVAPNRARYVNAGQALPTLKSRQVELGVKQGSEGGSALQWQVAYFDIQRPAWEDILVSTGLPTDSCSDTDPCRRAVDGRAHHRGLEAEVEWRAGAWSLRGSALALQARREGSADAARNGLRPTNVPDRSLKLQAAWNVPAVPGLALLAFASHEGARVVVPDNSIATDGWTRWDLGLRYAQSLGQTRLVWRAGVDNLTDARAWKESPYQYGHAYLYPLAPRTWRLGVNVTL